MQIIDQISEVKHESAKFACSFYSVDKIKLFIGDQSSKTWESKVAALYLLEWNHEVCFLVYYFFNLGFVYWLHKNELLFLLDLHLKIYNLYWFVEL